MPKKEKNCLPRSECICGICREILLEPVTLPCSHTLCYPCFTSTVEKASLCCPYCRQRVSNWARKNARSKTLVNKELWEIIQSQYPEECERRASGQDTSENDFEDGLASYPAHLICKPGEIRKEYEAEISKAPRKAISKTKNKECALCKVPLAVQWQKSLCIDCIQKTIQEETPDFASSLRAIIRAEVQDFVKAALKKKGSKHPEPVSVSEVSPSDEEGQVEPLSPCSSSPKSSDSSSDSDVGGRPCFLTESTDKLVKAVRASMGLKDEKAAKSLEDIMFCGLEEKRKRTFPVNSRIKALIEKEWWRETRKIV
ncbi:unnamed protein product [Ranitomeya imitator]|uniref:RING-type E3 ubiquitin transferase n=1 Tax=Ranitomeya imitator TaxID=111125 RepID=A0ABN9LH28_9NEOB|nr:unnamed protein product [Ranitomeya imitator]